jgi:NAD(P)-dependent dehydrogenase (short-subunit alcohol dehydrogenase family)
MKKTVLITGTSSGIGKTTALYFQQKGWNVAATMRNPNQEKELNKLPGIKIVALDVTSTLSIQNAITEIIQAFGNIDVIVNNAGYATIGPFEAATEEQIKNQFDTNVFGVMNVTRAILPYFREKKAGTIINITSMGGRLTFPLYSLYHSTKWAIEGYAESLQFELRSFNIKVKLIEPGVIKTDFYSRSEEVLKKDGLTSYDNYLNCVLPNIRKASNKAPGPEIIAEAIYKAANDSSWRLRYPAGGNGPALLFFRWLLPLSAFNFLVRTMAEKK